jgi:hypothetical protein
MKTADLLRAIEVLIATWQAELGSDVAVTLGGSLVSDTFVVEGAKVIDVDVRFLVENPDAPGLIERIERVTGLRYRKTIQVADWPAGTSTGHMIEGFLDVPGLPLPAEVEGCLRNRRYVGWHRYYQAVFSPAELAAFRADKLLLRGDKTAYKGRKSAMIEECKTRAIAKDLISPERAPCET